MVCYDHVSKSIASPETDSLTAQSASERDVDLGTESTKSPVADTSKFTPYIPSITRPVYLQP